MSPTSTLIHALISTPPTESWHVRGCLKLPVMANCHCQLLGLILVAYILIFTKQKCDICLLQWNYSLTAECHWCQALHIQTIVSGVWQKAIQCSHSHRPGSKRWSELSLCVKFIDKIAKSTRIRTFVSFPLSFLHSSMRWLIFTVCFIWETAHHTAPYLDNLWSSNSNISWQYCTWEQDLLRH